MSKDDTMTQEWERKESPHHIACQFQVTGGLEPCDCPEDDISITKERLKRLCADLDKQAEHYAKVGGLGGVSIRVALNGVATAIRDEFLSGKRR